MHACEVAHDAFDELPRAEREHADAGRSADVDLPAHLHGTGYVDGSGYVDGRRALSRGHRGQRAITDCSRPRRIQC